MNSPTATEIEFCLLGPLVVRGGGAVVPAPVPPGQQRAVLAALLLDAAQVLSLDQLTEVLWGSSPPRTARVCVQNNVMRLRKALGPATGARIRTQPPGYLIEVEAGELDVSVFEAHLEAARTAAGDGGWEAAADEAGAGLSLWRGEPLADVDSDLLATRDVPRLAELRLQALETRIDADLHLGRHAEVITGLQQLTVAHPLRERLHGLLMLALYQDGRQGEALAAYARARRILIDELGAEPGTGLRGVHQQILTAAPAVTRPGPATPVAISAAPAVPRELPPPVAHFAGRADELAALTTLLDRSGEQATEAVLISAIGGTAGVGKTALALHWAHRAAGRFPDGQLYVNLRGYDPGPPMATAEALAGFLRSLGVPGPDIPAEDDERAARYRSLLAGRRVLVILDNAGTAEQVRPLLPGTSSCTVLVTSRDALSGLVARDGAQRLSLDLLPLEDAVSLLRALIGPRVDAEPGAAVALAEQCGRLPLALRVAAELAATRSAVPLAELTGELADQQRRLDLLDAGGDPRTAVRAVFSWSYRQLDPACARAFRLLGLHPGPGFDPYAVAALIATPLGEARQLLDQLARTHLIQPAPQGRYGLHDLLRVYARELAATQDTEQERRSALTRLFDYYLATAAAAMDTLFPAERNRRPRIPRPATPVPTLAGLAAARSWLDGGQATLVAVTGHAAEHGWPGHTTRLAAILFRYLDTEGRYREAVTICARALAGARQAGDRIGEASARLTLGSACWRLGRYEDAGRQLRLALALCHEIGDRPGQARALSNLGVIESGHGRHEPAERYHRQALGIFRETGDRLGHARALDMLGGVLCQQGFYSQAAEHQREALEMYRQLGERHGEGGVLCGLGVVQWWQGRYDRAAGYLRQALAVCREIGDRLGQARALSNLGVVEWWQGRYQQAAERQREAAAVYHQSGDQAGEATALNAYGEALCAAGRLHLAAEAHDEALVLAERTGEKYQQGRAHDGLGYARHAGGHLDQARRHWERALTLYTSLSAPDATDARARLDELSQDAAGVPRSLTR